MSIPNLKNTVMYFAQNVTFTEIVGITTDNVTGEETPIENNYTIKATIFPTKPAELIKLGIDYSLSYITLYVTTSYEYMNSYVSYRNKKYVIKYVKDCIDYGYLKLMAQEDKE